jgi:hypothetical protein
MGDRFGAVEELIVGSEVPLLVWCAVPFEKAAPGLRRDVPLHVCESSDPFRPGVDHRLLNELLGGDCQHDMNVDEAMDGLLEHDEIGAGGSGRHNGARPQAVEHLRHAGPNGRDLRLRKPRGCSADEVDSVARVNQQHSGRVLPLIDRGGEA